MKVFRPGQPHRPGSAVKAPEVAGSKGKQFAAKLSQAERATAGTTAGARAATQPAQPAMVADLSAALAAGKLSAQAAVDKLVERIVDQQLGKAASASMRGKVAAALRQALTDDPLLAAKLRALGREG
jgi:hypothetical protein